MDDIKKEISVRCVFCKSGQFALPSKDYTPSHGSFIVCANCGRENDFTSLVLIVKAKAIEVANQLATDLIKNFQKDLKKTLGHNKAFKISIK